MSKPHVCRLSSIDDIEDGSLRKEAVKGAEGVELVYGKRARSQTEEAIAYLFDPARFSADEAKAWMEAKKIPYQEMIPGDAQEPPDVDEPEPDKMAAPETVEMDVEVLAVGTHQAKTGTVTFTAEDLATIEENSNALIEAGELKPPQKLGHDEDQSKTQALFPEGGAPALGWISRLTRKGEKLMAHVVQVPLRFAEALKSGAWRTRSAEVYKQFKDKPLVFRALAWYGADPVAIPSLADVIGLAAKDNGVLTIMLSESTPLPETVTDEPGTPADAAPSTPTTTEPDADAPAHAEPPTAPPAEPDAEPQEDVTMELAEMQAKLDEARKRAFNAELTRLVSDRRITPAEAQKTLPILLSLSDELADQQVALLAERPQAPDLTQPVGGNVTAPTTEPELKGEAKIMKFAEQYVAEGKGSYGAGLILAAETYPADAIEMEKAQGLSRFSAPKEG